MTKPWPSFENRLEALRIAAGVFSHIIKKPIFAVNGAPYPGPRTLEDFRGSVDSVFKAAGLEKVEW